MSPGSTASADGNGRRARPPARHVPALLLDCLVPDTMSADSLDLVSARFRLASSFSLSFAIMLGGL